MQAVDQSSIMVTLPNHILMEIISRLPIKTVMAIRCVCKSLLSIVSDPHFQILHSTRAPSELLVDGFSYSSTTLCFVDDSLGAVDPRPYVVFELPNAGVTFVNSCCGLVCYKVYKNRSVVICNPITREYITFPCPARMDKTEDINYGLGFSPKDNSFKLLRLIYPKNVDTCVGEIYTFGERESWKRVANSPHLCIGMEEAIFHEGALHWYCTRHGAMVTFDFDTELFGKLVTTPRWYDRCSSSRVIQSLAIGVFENCLYTTVYDGDFVVICALKEYGQDSWVRIFSIQKDDKNLSEIYKPFKYLQNGQVLMFRKHGGIVCFYPDTGSVKNVNGYCSRNEAVFIRPSLVSLKVLLGDNVVVHSAKPWDRKKAATIPRLWTSSVAVKDVVKADKDYQVCAPGSSAPMSSSEASTPTSHPTEEKVKEYVLPTILASQQGGADVGSFGSPDLRLLKDRRVDQSTFGTQKLVDEIETLKAENKQKGEANEALNAENDRMGKMIAKLKQGKKKVRAFMRFVYQQM